MDRDDFLTKKRLAIRRGQKWSLMDPGHSHVLPHTIEILEVKQVKEGDSTRYRCKIKEVDIGEQKAYRRFGSVSNFEITQFMYPGDILTYYEQI